MVREVTLHVDPVKLFDALKAISGNTLPLGQRLAGLLMTGEISGLDAIGLAVYGITVAQVGELSVPDTQPPKEG